jgi:hypothetical protein
LHSSGGLVDAQPTPCVSSSPQFALNRHKSEGATSKMRAKSSQSLQTHSGIAQPGLQVCERVKERAGARIRRSKRVRLEGYRRRNASVGRSRMCATCERGRPHQRWWRSSRETVTVGLHFSNGGKSRESGGADQTAQSEPGVSEAAMTVRSSMSLRFW